MDTQKGFIKYFIIIAAILAVAFLSQQAYSRGIGKTLVSASDDKIKAYMAEASNWVMANVYSKVTGEVQNRGDIMNAAVDQAKKNISENILQNAGDKIKNYISGVTNSIEGKNNNSCPPQPPQSSAPAN